MSVNQKHIKFANVSSTMLGKEAERKTRPCGELYFLPGCLAHTVQC